ncbi:MAG: aminotransferase class V-fold PLP-dependent enzyme [Polyangiaceae bacterium]|nr:aminotransferase class V-fold PLP-dependent enzyme [Polyangiaceae bacterium]
MEPSALDPDRETREALWQRAGELIEAHLARLRDDPDAPIVPHRSDPLPPASPEAPTEPRVLLERVVAALERGIVHVDHPRYFGLFNPAPSPLAVLGDVLASAYNPQLATRGHAPWPVAVEEELIRALGERFGWERASTFGAFASGGSEANATALECALTATFPEVGQGGLRALPGQPTVYVSAEGHATIGRAARLAGLGARAVRVIPTDARQRMKPAALREALAKDRADGFLPFMVVATAGTTSSGAIDPIAELAEIAARARAWLHVDAAWGGLAALVPELAAVLDGVGRADSITFDAHKVMSAPMGTGTILVRRPGVLEKVFADPSGYMPRDGASDPYARSIQWSRRFLGLRILMPLAAIGWHGYATSLRRQVMLADQLRHGLREDGWKIVNDTPLPIVCFVDGSRPSSRRVLDVIARGVAESAGGWVSVPRLSNGESVLRACVNNHRTEARDIDRLLAALDGAREAAR